MEVILGVSMKADSDMVSVPGFKTTLSISLQCEKVLIWMVFTPPGTLTEASPE
nr:hypothetical protein [Prevotella sp. Rep29]